MMCKKPFVRAPLGVDEKVLAVSDDARAAITPHACGQCLPCRINKARVWQHRLLLEQLTSLRSAFVTLTYKPEFLPDGGNLVPEDVTLFLKRLRYYLPDRRIRYYFVGEYGDRTFRPHYHGMLYDVGVEDEVTIQRAWSLGFVGVGFLTKHSCSYITGYVTKGLTKDQPVLEGRRPEFMRCSKMGPGGLGIEAIKAISEKLKAQELDGQVGIVRELKYGKKGLPLGRYLTKKLANNLGLDDNAFSSEFWDYQQELIESFNLKDEIFIDNFKEEFSGKVERLENRTKFFSKGKSL